MHGLIISKIGEFQINPEMYDNWLFFTLFLFPPKKRGKNKRILKLVFRKDPNSP